MRGREGEREGQKNECVVASHSCPGDLARNSGMCPDWESNQQPFGVAQSSEPYQPGLKWFFYVNTFTLFWMW